MSRRVDRSRSRRIDTVRYSGLEPFKESAMSLGTILLIVLLLMLVGALPTWPHSRSWGYGPTGGLGLVLIIVLVLVLIGRLGKTTPSRQYIDRCVRRWRPARPCLRFRSLCSVSYRWHGEYGYAVIEAAVMPPIYRVQIG